MKPIKEKLSAFLRKPTLAGFAFFSLLCAALPALSATGERALRHFLQNLHSLQADFLQISLSADGGRMIESRGTLYLKRPGRFRWEYHEPHAQLIIADGERVWLQDPELDQIAHQDQKTALQGTPAQLLISNAPLERLFRILPWDAGDQRDWVELQPRQEGQIRRIRVGFLRGQLDTLLMEDHFGQLSRFSFQHLRRNPPLSEDLFQMELPLGGDFLEF